MNKGQVPEVMPKLVWTLKWLCYFHLLPYNWDSKRLELLKCRRKYIWWLLTVYLGQLINVGNKSWTFFRVSLREDDPGDPGSKRSRLLLTLALTAGTSVHTYILLVMTCYAIDPGGIACVMNRIFRVLKSRPCTKSTGVKDIPVMMYAIRSLSFRACQGIIKGVVARNSLLLVYGTLPPSWRNPVTLVLYVLYNTGNSISWIGISILLAYPALVLNVLLDDLKECAFQPTLEKKLLCIRKMHVLRNEFERTFSRLCVPTFVAYCYWATVFGLFCIVCLAGRVENGVIVSSLITVSIMLLQIYYTYSVGGQLKSVSKSLARNTFYVDFQNDLGDERESRNNRTLKVIRNSCMHLQSSAGWIGKIKQGQLLSIISFIFIHTGRVLIAFSKRYDSL